MGFFQNPGQALEHFVQNTTQGLTGGSVSAGGEYAIGALDPTINAEHAANDTSQLFGGGQLFSNGTMGSQASGFNTIGQLIALYYGGQWAGEAMGGGSGTGTMTSDQMMAAGGEGTGGLSAGSTSGSIVGSGTTSTADSALMGVTPATPATTVVSSTTGNGLMGTVLGSNGQNIPALLTLINGLTQSGSGASGANAAAASDPFAAQRPAYQAMLRNLLQNPQAFMDTPMIQNQLNMGSEAVNRSAGARGLLNSGNRLAELTQFGQKVGSSGFMDYANLLGTLSGATTGSPAAAGQALTAGNTNNAAQNAGMIQAGSSLLQNLYANWGS